MAIGTALRNVHDGAGRSAIVHAMRGQVVAWGETVGVYERRRRV